MVVYHSFDEVPQNQATVLTIGTFDGLHKGHLSLINLLKERAKALNAKTLLLTFHPHPQIVLQKPNRPPVELLTTIRERTQLLSQLGIDGVLVIPFTKEFSQIGAEQFVRDYLVAKLNMKHMVIGYDHAFGNNRQGTEDLLTTLSGELRFSVEKAPIMDLEGETISSTKVRKAIAAGDIARANMLLGFPYLVGGKVVEGDGRGRKLGLPTANIEPSEPQKLLPKNGVYLVSAYIDGKNVYGMANVGIRPTFTDDIHPRLEVHFFDWNKMLYDREIMVAFLKFIRNERKFESTGLFFEQIVADRDECSQAIENIKQGKPF
ncbi:MAG: bifunctional riboflavin kinase/FAD synthetase [Candidatus Kapaibacteriota bacterium]|jgi:riboflavin kinase/FMN adenylyltransferase